MKIDTANLAKILTDIEAGGPGSGRYPKGSGHKDIAEGQKELEKFQVGSKIERLMVFDSKTGKKLLDQTGDKNSVTRNEVFLDHQVVEMHTHPDSTSFSDGDWKTFAWANVDEIRVIANTNIYTLTKTDAWETQGWQAHTPAKVDKRFKEIEDEETDISKDWDVDTVLDKVNQRMADEFGVKFTITPRTKVKDVKSAYDPNESRDKDGKWSTEDGKKLDKMLDEWDKHPSNPGKIGYWTKDMSDDEKALMDAKIKTQAKEPFKSGSTRPVMMTLEDGTEGVWKSANRLGSDQMANELAAWRIAKIVGVDDLLTPTVPKLDKKGELGIFSKFIPNTNPGGDTSMNWIPSRDLKRAAAFDLVTMQVDRHEHNWLVSDETGKIHLIDHGYTFGGEFDFNAGFAQKVYDEGMDIRPQIKPYVQNEDKIISVMKNVGMKDWHIQNFKDAVAVLSKHVIAPVMAEWGVGALAEKYKDKKVDAAFDPDEARNDRGEWTTGDTASVLTSMSKVKKNLEAHEIVGKIADKYGFPRGDVDINYDAPTFTLDGNQYNEAGEYTPSGKIKIFVSQFPDFLENSKNTFALENVAVHEMMHHVYHEVDHLLKQERVRMNHDLRDPDGAVDGRNLKGIMKPDGEIRDQYKKDYPVYTALFDAGQESMDGIKLLRESDGVTDYSKAWWSAFKNRTAYMDAAMNETLAEVAMMNHKYDSFQVSSIVVHPAWQKLYETYMDIYNKGGHGARK